MKKINTLLIMLFLAAVTQAQTDPGFDAQKQLLKASFDRTFANRFFNPNGSNSGSSFISTLPKLRLESTLGEQKASAGIGMSSRTNAWSFALEASQSFEEQPKQSIPYTLDGLNNNSVVSFSIQHLLFKKILFTDADVNAAFTAVKNEYFARTHGAEINTSEITEVITDGASKYYYQGTAIDSLVRNGDKATIFYNRENFTSEELTALNSITLAMLDDKAQAAFRKKFSALAKPYGFFNITGSVGKSAYTFITDSFSFSPPQEVSKNDWQLKLTAGCVIDREHMKSVLGLSYIYGNVYEAGSDPIDHVYAFQKDSSNFISSVSIGAPGQTTSTKIKLEWRMNFEEVPLLENYALSPSITYHKEKNAVALSVPVYFLKNKDEDDKVEGLSGGIGLSYATGLDTIKSFGDGLGANVFIAVPFDLFRGLKLK